MRLAKKQKDSGESDVNMTPMIDIVFQLIAFFMVITNFEQLQADERVKLPKDELAKPAETQRDKQLVVNIGYLRNEDGSIQADHPDPYVFYNGEMVPVLEFGKPLKQESSIYADLGVDPKTVTVVIRADRETPTGLVQEMIKLAQEAKFQKFALKAQQRQKP